MKWNEFFRENIQPMQPYQPGLREEQVREIAEVETIYKLSSNESPLPPFPSALAAISDKLACLNEYPDGSCHELTQTIARHYQVPPEQVLLGNGSNELIDLIAQTCLQPGDEVLYCWPSFVVYRSSVQIAAARSVELPLTSDGRFDLTALLAAVTPRTKLLFLCTPNNPTGTALGAEELAEFLDAVPDHLLVVIDAAYEEFITGPDTARPLVHFDGERPLAVLRTFSKIYGLAGIRMGYGLAPAPLVETVNKVREPFNVNTLAQAACAACLGDEAELAHRRQLNAEGRQRLYGCFEQLGLPFFRSEGNAVWVEVADPQAAFNDLLRQGIIVRPFAGACGLRVGVGDEAGVTATIEVFQKLFSQPFGG
ncbi:MAG: histidinol-phosphate transaminase [Actinomycetia bacterium]|nr:histidinol-phosphate transaminase [Actinomycetes bacterium]